jgi:hypothetical protein
VDRDQVSPNNNGTGKLYQRLIVPGFFLIPELVPKLIDYALKRMVRTFGSMEQA